MLHDKQVRSSEAVATIMNTQLQIYRANELMMYELRDATDDEVITIVQKIMVTTRHLEVTSSYLIIVFCYNEVGRDYSVDNFAYKF